MTSIRQCSTPQSSRIRIHEDLTANNNYTFFITPIWQLLGVFDACLATMVGVYDVMVYTPLEATHTPWLSKIPRIWGLGNYRRHMFTANNISFFRTSLVIPVALCLKFEGYWWACCLIVLHDYLDHLDGIVARIHKSKYGNIDDALLGGFLDAFCDKIVNILSLWSILLISSYKMMSPIEIVTWFAIIGSVIGYEFVLGVVRVQDYFASSNLRKAGIKTAPISTSASMEGKLKEKLESVGIALLCLAAGQPNPFTGKVGVGGIVSLILALRWAHASLMTKLRARSGKQSPKTGGLQGDIPDGHVLGNNNNNNEIENRNITNQSIHERRNEMASPSPSCYRRWIESDDSGLVSNESFGRSPVTPNSRPRRTRTTSASSLQSELSSLSINDRFDLLEYEDYETQDDIMNMDYDFLTSSMLQQLGLHKKVDKVYTVGCFDLFHAGHMKLLQRMRAIGNKVIVGVHDSRSIYRLKGKAPVQGTGARMTKVKDYADEVFVVSGSDPSVFMRCMVDLEADERALYVRGDDMPAFPGRDVVERYMRVWLVPYTKGISTTDLRRRFYPDAPVHFHDDL